MICIDAFMWRLQKPVRTFFSTLPLLQLSKDICLCGVHLIVIYATSPTVSNFLIALEWYFAWITCSACMEFIVHLSSLGPSSDYSSTMLPKSSSSSQSLSFLEELTFMSDTHSRNLRKRLNRQSESNV